MQLFTNNATAKLAAPVSVGASYFTLSAGEGALFPQPANASDYFYVRVGSDAGNEVMRCHARTDDAISCSQFTASWDADTPVQLSVNSQVLSRFPQIIDTDITIDVSNLETNSPDFYSIEDALAALAHILITDTALVTIRLRGPLSINSALSDAKLLSPHRIFIEGNFDGFKQINSIASSSGTAGAWTVVLNMVSAFGIAVGDYLYIGAAASGTNATALIGCHKVIAVSGNQVTVSIAHKTAVPSGAVTAEARLLKNVVRSNSCNGVEFSNGGFAGFSDVVFEFSGAGGYAGFSLQYAPDNNTFRYGGSARIGYGNAAMFCGIVGFSTGVAVGSNAAFVYANYGLMISGCTTGVLIDNGVANLDTVTITGCGKGLHVESGRVIAPGIKGYGCTDGVVASRAGSIRFSYFAEPGDAVIDGCTTGLTASHYGYISATGVTFSSNTTNASPAVDTVGNIGGYIDTVA